MEKKTKLTKEEEALRDIWVDKYLDMQTEKEPHDRIRSAVNALWAFRDLDAPEIIICKSPVECRDQCRESNNLDDFAEYWSIFYIPYCAIYDYCDQIGIEFDQNLLNIFRDWVHCCSFVLFNNEKVYVSERPNTIMFNEDDVLHNEEGKSVEFDDGWGVYSLNGVMVDEQIVMHPETQTIDQIQNEENEEIKRIRIERFGWEKYLNGINATLVDENQNDIEGTKEFLFTGDGITALLCICPSTGKEFVLEVPPETKTCGDAQFWLSGGLSSRVISAS